MNPLRTTVTAGWEHQGKMEQKQYWRDNGGECSNLKDIKPQVPEILWTQARQLHLEHQRKTAETQRQKETLKALGGGKWLIRIKRGTELTHVNESRGALRTWVQIFQGLKDSNWKPRILYLVKTNLRHDYDLLELKTTIREGVQCGSLSCWREGGAVANA